MDKKEHLQQLDIFLERMLGLNNEFSSFVQNYYRDKPKEKGKKSTEFYKDMSRMLDSFERCVHSMRDELADPDSIQGYDTR